MYPLPVLGGAMQSTHSEERIVLCPSCKKLAFPIELRCLKCDSILLDVPFAFESPDNRTKPPREVFCAQCGTLADDARITCASCLATLPRPFSLVAGDEHEFENEREIGRFEIVCSPQACEECKKFDGKRVSRAEVRKGVVPIPSCRHPMCWCTVTGIYRDEGVAVLE
jgi:hypothetical protein